MAIDPGGHEIRASAPGKKEWRTSLSISAGENKALTLPELEIDPHAPVPVASGSSAPAGDGGKLAPERKSGGRVLGWVIGGAGVASLGVGSYFGFRTLSKKKASDARCPTDTTCSDEGVKLNQEAMTAAWIANVGIGLGLAGVGIGTYLIVSGSSEDEREAHAPGRSVRLGATVIPGQSAQLDLLARW
jgi:hypothetical protein